MPKDGVWWLNYNEYEDLRIYEVGVQNCGPCYEFGPIIRERFILHYVYEGEGVLHIEDKEFKVQANQFFLLPPGELVHYQADLNNPWHYVWIQFSGFKATELLQKSGLTKKNPVFVPRENNKILYNAVMNVIENYESEYICMGNMYHLFQNMMEWMTEKDEHEGKFEPALAYVRSAIDYINIKYCEPIMVKDIAKHCGIDRAYLSKIFRHATGCTLQDYLIQYRMKKAQELLQATELSVQYVSYSVGYNDPFTFSKVFKKQVGVSPKEWRKQSLKQTIS